MQKLLQKITQGSLVKQIMAGLVAGILVALVSPAARRRSACSVPCSSAR